MDQTQFQLLTETLFRLPSRRDILRGLAGVGLGVGALTLSATANAKKHRKRKKRNPKATPNSFGCLEVDDPCKSAEQCCSGVCEGKKGKRTCRAHGAGTCQPQPGVCTNPDPGVGTCNNNSFCYCHRTTANSIYCAGQEHTECADCRKDADCVALGYPPESACIPYSAGICAGACASGMACVVPCGFEPVE